MDSNEKYWLLMAKSLCGEASPQELDELHTILEQNEQLQYKYDILCRIWKEQTRDHERVYSQEINHELAASIIEKAKNIELLEAGNKRVIKKRGLFIKLAVAASALFALFFVFYIFKDPGKPQEARPDLVAVNGKRLKFTLPDGSVVWLNAGSKLFYENDFKGATREVRLVGEAFFDIVKRPQQPFIVHANEINIKVLGTAFNVKAYEEERDIVTTLYRGLVNITKNGDQHFRPIMLYPNQKLIVPKNMEAIDAGEKININAGEKLSVPKENPTVAIIKIDSTVAQEERVETAWMYNRLAFKNEDFTTLAGKLEHWYDVKIIFEDEAVKKLSFYGSFENETIEQALAALHTANSFEYKIKNNEIFIKSKPGN